jgi:large conductance mechanosensitive channel
MRNSWSEFKAFALGGNMLDLALGFIIGTAFAALVESLAGNILLQLVAAIFGKPDFSKFVWTVNGTQICAGEGRQGRRPGQLSGAGLTRMPVL